MREQSLVPVVDNDTAVLVIGSMPGVQSLEKQQYYGNPRNHFWLIMSDIIGEPAPIDYKERLDWLLANRIGLWDAIASCERKGSLDSNIRNEVPNDFFALFTRYPQITHIVFNGAKAESVFVKKVGLSLLGERQHIRMPSTSPVPGRYIKTIAQKIEHWQIIREWLL